MDMPQEQAVWIGPTVVRPDGTADFHNAVFSESALQRLLDHALHQMTPAEIADEDRNEG